MATMKLYELVNHYHIGTELTCAEAMFMACNEYYHLNLSKETRKMFSVMGLGMQTEHSCCGAFTVAVGIMGGQDVFIPLLLLQQIAIGILAGLLLGMRSGSLLNERTVRRLVIVALIISGAALIVNSL